MRPEPDASENPIQTVERDNVLGRGAFGIVYHAMATRLNGEIQEVAVKQLDITPADVGTDIETNFRQEAEILCQLHHPNIVKFYSRWNFPWVSPDGAMERVLEHPNAIVMEYVPQGSLAGLIAHYRSNDRKMGWNHRIKIALDIGYGLQYLHDERRLIHLDLKTENVLLKREAEGSWTAKLADFGLTRTRASTLQSRRSRSRRVRGTDGYMAPEILEGGIYRTEADIYALAIIFWELVTHQVPYEGMIYGAIVAAVIGRRRLPFPDPTDCVPDFRSLIENCWAHEREGRPVIQEVIDRITAMSEQDVQLVSQIRMGELVDRLERRDAKVAELREERETAIAERDAAQERVRELETQAVTLTAARDTAITERDAAQERVRELETQAVTLTATRDTAITERDAARTTLATRSDALNAAMVAHNNVITQRDHVHAERDVAQRRLNEVITERDSVRRELGAAIAERDRRITGLEHIRGEHSRLARENPALQLENQRLQRQLENQAVVEQRVQARVQALEAQLAEKTEALAGTQALLHETLEQRTPSPAPSPRHTASTDASRRGPGSRWRRSPPPRAPGSPPAYPGPVAGGGAGLFGGTSGLFGRAAPGRSQTVEVDADELEQFLNHVVMGEQEEAEAMLKANPALMLAPGNVDDLPNGMRDLGGKCLTRHFENITGFQYALWAGDWYMWRMIQKYLPEAAQRDQLEEILADRAPWIAEHGRFFDLQSLIDALQTYVEEYENWTTEQRQTHWCKVVGSLQRELPMHVVNEYCRPDRSFDPVPDFRDPTALPRRGYADESSGNEYGVDWWFHQEDASGKLGASCAARRGTRILGEPAAVRLAVPGALRPLGDDASYLESLSNTQRQQVEELAESLRLTAAAGTSVSGV